jgi:hypothetical protein
LLHSKLLATWALVLAKDKKLTRGPWKSQVEFMI